MTKKKIQAQAQRILDLLPLIGEDDPLFPEIKEEISSLSKKLENWALEQF